MSELDEKLNSILSNPQMMQQIKSLAESMGNNNDKGEEAVNAHQTDFNGFDTGMLSSISNLMQRSSIDRNQRALLAALSPYLSHAKLQKLEKAMHAAKMAGIASELPLFRK